MKSYIVLVESEDYIDVEAETDEEAISKALRIVECQSPEWKGSVVSAEDTNE
jgi:hypothetical protein